ncbi:MAG: hypothetical protein C3F02_01505 [Parcubacteria group bacterium]|nr:MAG: hypothetical protein C3F02_01505 [Parcubacteria group bacterium]
MPTQNNAAKFAFFYMLSLIALVFVAVASGTILFQIINKLVPDIANIYSSMYLDEAMRFGISALIIASPIFYITARQIYKSLYNGSLSSDSGVRKWLTYLILLVSIIVMIAWLIAILNGFLSGELTAKFVLKALTAIIISGIVFSFYFYDIRRDDILNKVDKVIKIYFFASLAVIVVILIAAFMNVESPAVAREKKIDQQVINNFYTIQNDVDDYYNTYKKMPASLSDLTKEYNNLTPEVLNNPSDNTPIEYKVNGDRGFELCTTFKSANKGKGQLYQDTNWLHDAGYQCLRQNVSDYPKGIVPAPMIP